MSWLRMSKANAGIVLIAAALSLGKFLFDRRPGDVLFLAVWVPLAIVAIRSLRADAREQPKVDGET
jgi:hypothetical protein